MEVSLEGEERSRGIAAVLAHFSKTTAPLLAATRQITNSEPTFANSNVRDAMDHLARIAGPGSSAATEADNAMFHLAMADLNCLKISLAEVFRLTDGVLDFIAEDDQDLPRGIIDEINALKSAASHIFRHVAAEWDVAALPARALRQGGGARLGTDMTRLEKILTDSLAIYERLRDTYSIPENLGRRDDMPHAAKKLFYASSRDKIFLGIATAVAAGVAGLLGNLVWDVVMGALRLSQSGAPGFLVATAFAETGRESRVVAPGNTVSVIEIFWLSGVLAALLTCLFLIVRRGTDKATLAWARDLIKIIVGFAIGHFTKAGG